MKTRSVAQNTFASPEPKVNGFKPIKDRTHADRRTNSLALKKVVNSTPKSKTPRRDKKRDAVTPLRDEILFSQHFDSQVEVGWDCNSPNAVRGLQRISGTDETGVSDLVMQLIRDEPDELPGTRRSTPPLLGIWKDTRGEDQLLETEEQAQQPRFKKRGRTRRKSGKESAVSLDLLQKLTSVLDQNADKGPDTRIVGADSTFPDDDDDDDDQVFNVSSELFTIAEYEHHEEKLSHKLQDKDKSGDQVVREKKDVELKSKEVAVREEDEDLWEDDELFDNSYIIKATQIPTEASAKLCPSVFSTKRKLSIESALPKSKCSRYTFKLGDDNDPRSDPLPTPVSSTAHHSVASSSSSSKHSLTFRSDKNPVEGNNNYTTIQSKNCTQNRNMTAVNSLKPPTRPSYTTTQAKQTLPSAKHTCATNNPKQDPSSVRQSKGTSASTKKYNQPCSMQSTSGVHSPPPVFPGNVAKKTMSDNADNNSRVLSNVTTGIQSTLSRSGSFKKHSSFPGPEKSDNNNQSSYSRQRSMSGTLNRQSPNQRLCSKPSVTSSTCVNTPVTTASLLAGQSRSSTVMSSQFYGNATRIDQKCAPVLVSTASKTPISAPTRSVCSADRSVSTTRMCSTVSSSVSAVIHSPLRSRGSVGSAFDTSLSDELLFQLAEPDDVLDCGKATLAAAPNAGKSNTNKTKTQTTLTGTRETNLTFSKSNSSTGTSNAAPRSFKFKESQKESLHNSKTVHKPKPVSSTTNSASFLPPPKMEKATALRPVPEAYSEDLFPSDDDDDLLGDGLTEPEILAMLDEAESIATQQLKSSQSKETAIDKKTNCDDGVHSDNSQSSRPSSQNCPHDDKLPGSQGSHTGSQGRGSQGTSADGQGQLSSSQGFATQTKCSQADIERKKLEALERRKKKMKKC